jgi:hypothetical protein
MKKIEKKKKEFPSEMSLAFALLIHNKQQEMSFVGYVLKGCFEGNNHRTMAKSMRVML